MSISCTRTSEGVNIHDHKRGEVQRYSIEHARVIKDFLNHAVIEPVELKPCVEEEVKLLTPGFCISLGFVLGFVCAYVTITGT